MQWWSKLRKEPQKEGSVAVDIRTYEDLLRLTQSYARLHLDEVATISHAKDAIKMLNTSLHTLGMDTPGQKNDSIATSFDKTGYIAHVFKTPVTEAQAVSKLMERTNWFPTEDSALRQISKLRSTGNLLDSGGKYSWVS